MHTIVAFVGRLALLMFLPAWIYIPKFSYLVKKSIHSQLLKKAKINIKCPYCSR